jgi:hypothetical protein
MGGNLSMKKSNWGNMGKNGGGTIDIPYFTPHPP